MSRTRKGRWIATLRGAAMAILLGAFMLTLTAVGSAALEHAQGPIRPASQAMPAGAQQATVPDQAAVPPTPTPVP
jgi:hypothetical protein